VERPIHLNRALRKHGYLSIRTERGLELLDAGASKAFAVADHQICHIYLNDQNIKDQVKELLEGVPGVEQVLDTKEIAEFHLNHERAGDLIAVADKNSWFTYYFWMDDAKAPDYARMVDIHKKPGYDPVEMLTDPADKLVVPKILWKLLKKKIGFRTVMDVIPLKAELIKGSHGRKPESLEDWPIFITDSGTIPEKNQVLATEVFSTLEKIVKNQI